MRKLTFVLTILPLGTAGWAQGCARPPAASAAAEPETAPEPESPDPPAPVYTSAVCCATGLTCALGDGAQPLGTTCSCSDPEGSDLQGHAC